MAFRQPVSSLCLRLDDGNLYYCKSSLINTCSLIKSFIEEFPESQEMGLPILCIADVELLLSFLQSLNIPSDRNEIPRLLKTAEYLCLLPKYSEILRKEAINKLGPSTNRSLNIPELIIGLEGHSSLDNGPIGIPGPVGYVPQETYTYYRKPDNVVDPKAERIRNVILRYKKGKLSETKFNQLIAEIHLYPAGYRRINKDGHRVFYN